MNSNFSSSFSSSDSPSSAPVFSLGMVILYLTVGLLSLYGLFFIYSTGYIGDAYPVRPNWLRQIVWLLAGAFVGWLVSFWDNRRQDWRVAVWFGYVFWCVALLLVLMVGIRVGGARRWLTFGPIFVQPAEFAKLFTVLAAAQLLGNGNLRWFYRWAGLFAVAGIPFFLILAEPAYGNAFALLPPLFVLCCFRLLSLGWWRLLLCLLILLALCFAGGVSWLRTQPQQFLEQTISEKAPTKFFHAYHLRRMRSFLNQHGDWNERQSVMTLAGGGWLGKGYLQGTMKELGYLPRTVAPTDFIFSVIGEELGLLRGTLPVLMLYGVLVSLSLHWAGSAPDQRSAMTGVAVAMLLATHVAVNVGMTVRLIPVIGLPLPLLSYGGSFTMATMLGVGIMVGVARQREMRDIDQNASATREWKLGSLLHFKIKDTTVHDDR